jgi:GNAT superfamily N-acetyltransferase
MPTIERVLGHNQAHFYRRRLDRGGVILTAWHENELTGAICVSFEPADEPLIRQHLAGVPLLYRLQVKDGKRSQGIGTGLITQAEQLVKGRNHSTLAFGVDTGNRRPMRLYRRLGYREWDHGEVDTVRELYTIDGQLDSVPDRCMIFVKRLV